MRTTLTLDDDVAAAIERLRRARDASLKDIVNEALRKGLSDLTTRPKQRECSTDGNFARFPPLRWINLLAL